MVYSVELNKAFLYNDQNITTPANGAPLPIIICVTMKPRIPV